MILGSRTWHVWLIPLPVVGWFLLLAYILDDWSSVAARSRDNHEPGRGDGRTLGRGRRLAAAALDFMPFVIASLLLPPAFAWLFGSGFLLFRDAGANPWSLGKRTFGLSVSRPGEVPLSFTESFSRNLPLLLPYLGPLIEGVLLLAGRERLGDRLAGTRVGSHE